MQGMSGNETCKYASKYAPVGCLGVALDERAIKGNASLAQRRRYTGTQICAELAGPTN